MEYGVIQKREKVKNKLYVKIQIEFLKPNFELQKRAGINEKIPTLKTVELKKRKG
jgi:hypothetical protein